MIKELIMFDESIKVSLWRGECFLRIKAMKKFKKRDLTKMCQVLTSNIKISINKLKGRQQIVKHICSNSVLRALTSESL